MLRLDLQIGRMMACTVALATVLSGSYAMAQEQVVWRFGHTLSVPGTLYETILTEEVPARLNEASGGMLKVQPIIGIVKTDDVISALAQGRIEIGNVTTGYVAATYPSWAVLNLPGLVEDMTKIAQLSDEIVLPLMAEELKNHGITPVLSLGWVGGAFFSRKRIETVEDFAGLTWRTHAPMLSELVTAAGGAAVGMPYAELYPSLERGLVDSYTSTLPPVANSGLPEVTDYAILGPNGTSVTVLMVSDAAVEALPAEVREDVLAELEVIRQEIPERLVQEVRDSLDKLSGVGVEVIDLPEAEKEKLRKISRDTVWQNWLELTGDEGQALIEQVQSRLSN